MIYGGYVVVRLSHLKFTPNSGPTGSIMTQPVTQSADFLTFIVQTKSWIKALDEKSNKKA